MKNRGSTPILPNLVGVHPRNIHTKFEANPCSGLREVENKQCLIRETCFQRNMCETANQQSIPSHMVVYMAFNMRCHCALSRNRSLRDAKPARHLFV